MKLNFPDKLMPNEIIGRLLGPDLHNGYSVALDVEWVPELNPKDSLDEPVAIYTSSVTVRPAAPKELKSPNVVIDKWGQPWLSNVMTQKVPQ